MAIDHNRTFMHDVEPPQWANTYWRQEIEAIRFPKRLGDVYQRFKTLPEAEFRNAISEYVPNNRVELFLATRAKIIDMLDKRIRRQ